MAKKNPKYVPGYRFTVILDGVDIGTMNCNITDTTESSDKSTNKDLGWSLNETEMRTVTIGFQMPVKATDTASPLEDGAIYPMEFRLNDIVKFAGDFRCTQCNINSQVRTGTSYDIAVENYGNVTPP